MAKKSATKRRGAKIKVQPKEKPISVYDKWITYLCYAILVVLPLAISRVSYDQFDLVKLMIFRILVLAAVLVWLAKMLKEPESVSWSWREGLLVGFLVVAVLSTITSIHIPTSLHGKYKRYEGLLTFITYISIYFVAMQTFRRKNQLRILMEVVSIVGGIVALYGIMQYIDLDPIFWGNVPFEARRSFSTFGNPDLLAGYLVLAFPCAIVAFLDANKRRWLHGVSAFILATGLVTALTRSGWAGALVSVVVVLVLLGRGLKPYWRHLVAIGVAMVLMLSFMVAYSLNNQLDIIGKFKGAFQLNSGTALGRFEIWKAGFFMLRDRPFFGQGLGTFRLASEHFETERYVRSVSGTTVSDNAHNYIVQLAAGGGPLAVIFLYGFFIFWMIRAIGARRKTSDTTERLMIVGAVASVAGYLTVMMLGISIVGASSTFWLIMAAVAGVTSRVEPNYRSYKITWSQELRLGVSIVIVLVTMVSTGIAVSMYAGDVYFVKALRSSYGNQRELAISQFNTAASLYPGNGRVLSNLGQTYTKWASAAMQAKDSKNFDFYANQAVSTFERARASEPPEVDYQIFLANAHGHLSQNDKALEILKEIIEYRPHSVPGNLLSGMFKERVNKKEEAIEHYKKVIAVAPTHKDALTRLIQALKDTGRNKEAARYTKELEEINARAAAKSKNK